MKRLALFPTAIVLALAVAANAATAQTPNPKLTAITAISTNATVRLAMQSIERENAWTLDQQASLCEIPAPPFKEAVRAAEFQKRLIALGVKNVHTDAEGNVIGEIRGATAGPTVVLSGHLDTVFPEGTNVSVKREGTRMTGPGIGDDCRGLAVVLTAARQIINAKIPIAGRLLVIGTMGEEGPGNLRGVRALFRGPLKDSINIFLSVDGTGFGITNGGVGSNRYRVSYVGPGGHSYGAFGMPNPIHAMGRAIAKIADLQSTTDPKVTFNVGMVSGGTSVNSISADGTMEIDLRSESASALAAIDAKLQVALREALAEERARWPKSKVGLDIKIDTMGLRPAGRTPDTASVVRIAQAAASVMQVKAELNTSSTDANIPMSLHVPSITLDGGGTGRGSHSLDEYYDDGKDGFKGPQWVLLVVLGLLGVK